MPHEAPPDLSTSTQDQRVEELRKRLIEARRRRQSTLDMLGHELSDSTDWRVWVRAQPAPFLAAAFVAGFLLARRR